MTNLINITEKDSTINESLEIMGFASIEELYDWHGLEYDPTYNTFAKVIPFYTKASQLFRECSLIVDYSLLYIIKRNNSLYMDLSTLFQVEDSKFNIPGCWMAFLFESGKYVNDVLSYFREENKTYVSTWFMDSLISAANIENKSKANQKEKATPKTYIMYDPSNNLYKIGRSVNIQYREKTLRGDAPLITTVMYCDENVESALHKAYAHLRMRGEWFSLDKKDLVNIMREYGFKKNN